MDAVQSFNNELGSMFETKPPISKAKMTSVTKAAIKAIKFYKHVVQSVEKFIQKSRAEYKVPGLYVIDSIVRQSRHQFGAEKDVYAVRFSKNFASTFQHLFKCPVEEKSKIVRVLNLWQKNNVFSSEVIQPLLDMANPNHAIHQQSTPSSNLGTPTFTNKKGDGSGWSSNHDTPQNSQSDASQSLKTVSQMLQQSNAMTTSDSILQGGSNSNTMTAVDSNLVLQLQQITNLLTQQNYMKPEPETTVKFNKKLLAFDYGDEDDEDEDPRREETPVQDSASLAVSMAQNLLSNPDILRQLQQMQQTIQQTEALKTEVSLQEQLHKQRFRAVEEDFASQIPAQSLFSAQMLMEQAAFNQSLNRSAMVAGPTLSTQMTASPSPVNMMTVAAPPVASVLTAPPGFVPIPPVVQEAAYTSDMFPAMEEERRPSVEEESGSEREKDDRCNNDMEEERQDQVRSPRFREKSRSPVPLPASRMKRRTRKSRSRSRSPKRRMRSRSRSRSRSKTRYKRERDRDRSREREKEKEKERERERKKRGLPPIKKECLSVCSTTLWLGHVSKLVSQEDLADAFGEIGDIVAIDLIPPRGCAFVCMNRRQDSFKALLKLKNLKLQGKTITMAWAPGKGVKGKDFKDYWDVELGVSYIPWDKLPDDLDVDALEDGGMIDEETIPERLRERIAEKAHRVVKDVDLRETAAAEVPAAGLATPSNTAATPSEPSHTMQPTVAVMPPMVQPPMVQQPYGLAALSMIQLPMGVPTAGQLMMVPPVGQQLLGQGMPVMAMVGQHFGMPPTPTTTAPLPTSAAPSEVLPPLPLDNPCAEDRASGRETADSTSTDVSQTTMPIQTSTIPMPSGQPAMTPTRSDQMDLSVTPSPHNMHRAQGPPLPVMPPGALAAFQQLQPPPPPFGMSGPPLLARPPAFRMQHPSVEHQLRSPISMAGMLGPGPRSGPPRDGMDDKDGRWRALDGVHGDPWERMNVRDVDMFEFPKEDDSPRHRHLKRGGGSPPPRSMIAPPPMVPLTLARHINASQEMQDCGPRPMLDRMGPPRDDKESHGRFGHPPPPFQGGIPAPLGRYPAPRIPGGPGVPPPRQPFLRFPQGPGGPGSGPGPGLVPRGPGPVPRMPGHPAGQLAQHHPMQQPRGMLIGYPRGPGPGPGPQHFMRPARPPDMNDFGIRSGPQPHHMARMQRPFDDRFGHREYDDGGAERRLGNHQRQRHAPFNRHDEDMGHQEECGDRGGGGGDWRRERGRGRGGMGGPGRDRFGRGGFGHEERYAERFDREWEPMEHGGGGGWDSGGGEGKQRGRGRDRDQGPGDRSFRGDRERDRDRDRERDNRERERERSGDGWDNRDDQPRDRAGGRRSRWCEPSPSKAPASDEVAENAAPPENGATAETKTKDCDAKVAAERDTSGDGAGNGPSAPCDEHEAAPAAEVAVDA